MVKEIGRGELTLLRRPLERRLSTPWPAAMLQTLTLFRADGLTAKVLLTACATVRRERGVPRSKVQRVLDAIEGNEPLAALPPNRLRASYAQFAALLIEETAPVEAIRRVQRAVWTLERSEWIATNAIPGSANEFTVLPELSGQISTNLWHHGWIQELNGPALWIYLYIHTHIYREGGRIGRKMAPRAGPRYMTVTGDLITKSGLSYPTIMNGLRVLRDLKLISEVRRGRDTHVNLVDPDLWNRSEHS